MHQPKTARQLPEVVITPERRDRTVGEFLVVYFLGFIVYALVAFSGRGLSPPLFSGGWKDKAKTAVLLLLLLAAGAFMAVNCEGEPFEVPWV